LPSIKFSWATVDNYARFGVVEQPFSRSTAFSQHHLKPKKNYPGRPEPLLIVAALAGLILHGVFRNARAAAFMCSGARQSEA
jgi:hypothetical protein